MLKAFVVAAVGCVLGSVAASGQTVLGESPSNPANKFVDTSSFHPPAGAKVAILEWEDLECPMCARVFPTVHAALKHYNIPIVERDFLIPGHVWSPTAALYARYLHEKVSPELSTEYRREVFASQFRISSRDDLQHFTENFFKTNGKPMPFVLDPDKELQKKIDADVALGQKVGVGHTPTLLVVSASHWTEVLDIDQLYAAIDAETARASAATHAAAPARAAAKKK